MLSVCMHIHMCVRWLWGVCTERPREGIIISFEAGDWVFIKHATCYLDAGI